MNAFTNTLIKYEKPDKVIPHTLSTFKCVPYTFILTLDETMSPVYTLNKVSIHPVSTCVEGTSDQIDSFYTLPISGVFNVTFEYSTCTLQHLVSTTQYSFSLIDTLSFPLASPLTGMPKPYFYVEDLFAYCLDETHIYTHVLFLLTSNVS